MTVKERLEQVVRRAVRRPGLTVGVVIALAVLGGLLALRLEPSTGIDTFVSGSSPAGAATADNHRHFGDDAVVILIREPLTDLVETRDLATVTQLEACMAGQTVVANQQLSSFTPAPAGSSTPYGGWSSPCGALMKSKPVQVVYGPGTFLNRAVAAVNQQIQSLLTEAQQAVSSRYQAAYQLAVAEHLSRSQALIAANAAAQLEQQQETDQLAQLYLDSGISGTPRIDDPQFIPQIVFDQSRGVNEPKSRFAYLFPTANSALIQVRLKSSLSDSQQAQAISLIRQAVKMPMFQSSYGGTYTVTGAPVVLDDLASAISGSIATLLLVVIAVMAATLLVVFRKRPRLLPLGIALAAVAITFGLASVVGGSLTMASIAVLPILIGLAVDYAIQFQSRAQEAGQAPAEVAVVRASKRGVPAIATAALATATGFLVLLLSPVPMVQGFGLLLVVGIAVAFGCALTAGAAALVLAERDDGIVIASLRGAGDILRDAVLGARDLLGGALRGVRDRLGGATRGVRDRLGGAGARPSRPLARPASTTSVRRAISNGLEGLLAWPSHMVTVFASAALALALLVAIGGWVTDSHTPVQSDVTKLVPSNMPALRDLHTLERVTGVSGEIDVTVRSEDVTRLGTVQWMTGYEQSLLSHFGYLESNGCARATLCPALSLPDLFQGGAQGGAQVGQAGVQGGQDPGNGLTQASITQLLSSVPSYFSQAVITPDHHEATLAFGIRLMPLEKQQHVIDYMRSQLHPPPGVTANLTGLPVLAAQASSSLSSSGHRLLMTLVGLLAVGLVLFAVFRDLGRAVVPLVPIALATGWSALILFATGIPLNPMSATLGTLVIAISTEFSVLLSERFRQEREAGYEPREALRRTYLSTGRAVVASGITAIAGFGVLVVSNITMLRDFGAVTLIDLAVSLGGVLLVLPAVLALSERDLPAMVRRVVQRAGAELPWLRGRARVA